MATTIKVHPCPQKDDIRHQDFPLGDRNEGFEGPEEIKECSCCYCSRKPDGEVKPHANTRLTDKLESIRNRYLSSFTMHALNHIAEGTVLEKVFWTIKLLGAIAVAVYLCWNFFMAFFNYEVDTQLKVVVKSSIQFPTILLCSSDYKKIDSFNNCSSNMSISYDTDICTSLGRRCPHFYPYDDAVRAHNTDEPDSCEPELLGQCIVLNANGTLEATLTDTGMFYGQEINASMFPLKWYINPPGIPLLADWGKNNINIDRFGEYEFTITKTMYIRKPAPYSKPHCVEKDSPEALRLSKFTGPYTVDACTESCFVEQQLNCGVILNSQRDLVKDRDSLKLVMDRNISNIDECLDSHWDEQEKCNTKCFLPCVEEHYDVHDIVFYPWSDHGRPEITVLFQYKEMRETHIVEVPTFDFKTLIANFGGTLGLMTGMSAISIIELLYWVILFLVGRIHLIYENLMNR